MKRVNIIFEIAAAELRSIFCSPIAWVLLLAFIYQVAGRFVGLLTGPVFSGEMGAPGEGLTEKIYMFRGLLGGILGSIYFYIPLLTMGLISREFNSGSIKLLYSSPISNLQIVLGKYLSMVVFSLIMTLVVSAFVLYGFVAIENFDFTAMLPGLLGIFLLICTYAAIGLFMSSVTTYQFVAAISTFTILGALSYVKYLWQDMEFVRDITFWLGLSGRVDEMLRGMLCSDEVVYFVMVSGFFVTLTVMRLNAVRQKLSFKASWTRYLCALLVTCAVGYVSSRPVMMKCYDATHTKKNSLSKKGQEILTRMTGGLTITTYVNYLDRNANMGMPQNQLQDKELRLRLYWRFKPEIKFKYVYFYDEILDLGAKRTLSDAELRQQMLKNADINEDDTTLFMTPAQIRSKIDLSSEGNRYVRLAEREGGEKVFIRCFDDNHSIPSESETLAAFNRIVGRVTKLAYLTTNGTLGHDNKTERGYGRSVSDQRSRYAMVNNGYDVLKTDLSERLSDDIDVLFVADVREPLSEEALANLKEYIDRGGNLVINTDAKHQAAVNSLLALVGVEAEEGQLVCQWEQFQADLVSAKVSPSAKEFNERFALMGQYGSTVLMPGCVSLKYVGGDEFKEIPLLETPDKNSWNELSATNFTDDKPALDVENGEVEQSNRAALALTREVNGKLQKIAVIGDSDYMSNGELSRSRLGLSSYNIHFTFALFEWMADNEAFLYIARENPIDNKILIKMDDLDLVKIVSTKIIPILMILAALFIWIRRRSR